VQDGGGVPKIQLKIKKQKNKKQKKQPMRTRPCLAFFMFLINLWSHCKLYRLHDYLLYFNAIVFGADNSLILL